jgi:putative PIG3 family NAD(P)H quinone oxidoreductase
MKAVYIEKFGSEDDLELREVPDLADPKDDQVLVRVRAAGLNRADLLQVRGHYPPPPGYSPNIPGLEFAGEVVSVGASVERWKPGDRVFGITAGETQAELLMIDEKLLAKVPTALSFVEAAAIPEVFITAYDAIFTLGELKKDETLLVHAVGSGVGLAALQLAKAKGARVIGTSRTADKLEKCREFGLDEGIATGDRISFSKTVNERTEGGADVILDLVGAAYFAENLKSLARKGRMILVGLMSGSKAQFDMGTALDKRARIIGRTVGGRPVAEKAEAIGKFANEVIPLFNTRKVRPNIDRVFPAADVVKAYKYLASDQSFGKVVLEF